jgi:ABC-2 type transport system ATP-binding protein
VTEKTSEIVVTRKLRKVFRDFWLREKVTAVDDLDLSVRPREVFGLLGPNGSGKSTTLKMILGLLFPTSGQISVFGRPPSDVASKARIGFLPEESHLYPFLNAVETLEYFGKLFQQPRPQRRNRIEMLLEMVGLQKVAYRRVGEYSKGMQRRIGLAQALINDPDLLILDEPTSGMDPVGTRQFKDLIRMLSMRGKTVIVSSHLLADVEDVCDRVAILYGGRLREQGTVEELLAREHLTQITTDELDEPTLERLQRMLRENGRQVLDVSAPRDRLETLFLRIVEDARQQRLATGGAESGGRVAEFLRGEDQAEGREVIERLVEAAETADAEDQDPTPAEPAPAAQRPRREVLDSLTRAADEPAEEPLASDAPPQSPPPEDERVDRQLIEGLMGGEKPDTEDRRDDEREGR